MSTASAAIDRAHLVMLAETGILERRRRRAPSPGRSTAIDRESTSPALTYTGEVEDYFFLVENGTEGAARRRISPGGCTPAARATTSTTRCSSSRLKSEIDRLAAKAARLDSHALIDVAERESGDADRRLYPRPAGAAHDLRPLSRRRSSRCCCATSSGSPPPARIVDLSPDGRGRHHHLRLSDRPRARRQAARLRRADCAIPMAASPPSTTSPRPIRPSS